MACGCWLREYEEIVAMQARLYKDFRFDLEFAVAQLCLDRIISWWFWGLVSGTKAVVGVVRQVSVLQGAEAPLKQRT
jgi:hypothetical protein